MHRLARSSAVGAAAAAAAATSRSSAPPSCIPMGRLKMARWLLTRWLSGTADSILVPYREVKALPKIRFDAESIQNVLSKDKLSAMARTLGQLTPVRLSEMQRRAAVLVPLCRVDGKPSVLFTLRSGGLSNHSGEVSFPGGMMDATDPSSVHAAIRECREEVAIDVTTKSVLGIWHDVPNKDQTVAVSTVVAYLGDLDPCDIHARRNESEVEEVFTMGLGEILDPDQRGMRKGRGVMMPVFTAGPHEVWGLTAYVLAGVLNTCVVPHLRPAASR